MSIIINIKNRTMTIKAIVKTAQSREMKKSNGSTYVLLNCEIQEGPAKGHIVAATRTTSNKDGTNKSIPSIGDEVVLYHSVLPSTKEPGSFVHFFEIGTGVQATSHDELTALLGVPTTNSGI